MKTLAALTLSGAVLVGCGDSGTSTTASGGAGGHGGHGGATSTTVSSSSENPTKSTTDATGTGSETTTASESSSTGYGGGLPDGPSSGRLNLRPIGTVPNAPLGYFEYLPPGYGDGKKYSIMLFHHGIGQSGDGSADSLAGIYATGLPALIKNDTLPAEAAGFIILGSQHNAPPNTDCHSVTEIDDFTKFAIAHYDVDLTRVYLTGLSCGAIGSWNYLGAHTNEIFAAAVLISGDGHGAFGQAGCSLGKLPIWAFHGDMDGTVNDSGSIDPINSLNACTNPKPVDAELTLYPGVGHDAWDMTYDLSAGHDIYAWMLKYTHP